MGVSMCEDMCEENMSVVSVVIYINFFIILCKHVFEQMCKHVFEQMCKHVFEHIVGTCSTNVQCSRCVHMSSNMYLNMCKYECKHVCRYV